jgi:hypothetical protein
MSSESCSATDCTKAGTLRCTGCNPPQSRYCSTECQKQDWKTHKQTCVGGQKYNCFLIHTSSLSTGTTESSDSDYIEPFPLRSYGNWQAEMGELKERLGWTTVGEAGKFYSHQDVDTWYYYAYSASTSGNSALPKNEIGSRCIGRAVFGDIAVVRSGPVGSKHADSFSKMDLVKTAKFYRTAVPDEVFAKRERSRFFRNEGISQDVPAYHMSLAL